MSEVAGGGEGVFSTRQSLAGGTASTAPTKDGLLFPPQGALSPEAA